MRSVEGLLIDLDGTVYQGRELIPGSATAIAQLRDAGIPFLFTTNTSRMSRSDITASLQSMGLPVHRSEIFSAPVAAARWLSDEGLRRIQLLVPDSTREDFADFEIVDEDPDAVLVGDLGAGFTFAVLCLGVVRELLGNGTEVHA